MYETDSTASFVVGNVIKERGQISVEMELLQKNLEELNAEMFGLNGTFSPVLRPKPPEIEGKPSQPEPAQSTEIASFLNDVSKHVLRLTSEARSLRDRCEL